MIKNKYDPFIITNKKYAEGGNAKILLVKDHADKNYVLKVITINEKKDITKVKRFINEINIVEKYQNKIKGMIPIIHKHIPNELLEANDHDFDKLKKVELWYVMDLAIPLEQKIKENNNLEQILDCIISLSTKLDDLHKHNIKHRDIKPSNLYFYKGDWAFGDFGLVEYPEFSRHTKDNVRIGNHATIAPEMRRSHNKMDTKPADVWSMAKTLWMLLNNKYEDCFEGSYNPNDKDISLRSNKRLSGVPLSPLEKILSQALEYKPEERIEISEFVKLLIEYKKIISDQTNIFNTEKLVEIRETSTTPYIHNNADICEKTSKIIYKFYMDITPEDYIFIEAGHHNKIEILRYISMRLVNYCEREFIVSPITHHFRNSELPSITIFVKYTKEESKFVTHLVVGDDGIYDFSRGANLELDIDNMGRVEWEAIDRFINHINDTAFNPCGVYY